jgi:hypothetical protein
VIAIAVAFAFAIAVTSITTAIAIELAIEACCFIYSLPPVSFFLDQVAMEVLRRRMQVLREIWPDKPLPPPLAIFFFLLFLFLAYVSVLFIAYDG